MARTATLTVTHSSNPATSHIGPFFADLRVGQRQRTKVGKVADINSWIAEVKAVSSANGVTLVIADETFRKDFTALGGTVA